MKILALFLFFATSLVADSFTLENKTSFQKIAIQWASSARAVQESNDSLMQEDPLPKNLYYLKNTNSKVPIPANASYFRILVWENQDRDPNLLTNWVDIIPNKTYLIDNEHLTPVVLMNGMGC